MQLKLKIIMCGIVFSLFFLKHLECAGNKICNCEKNDNVWRQDDGWLTDKEDLPVTAISVSDTGSSIEKATVTLGPLTCWGRLN